VNHPNLIVHLSPVYNLLAMMLYVGPDAVMPLLSVLGAIAGGILMFWRRLSSMVRRLVKPGEEKQEAPSKSSK
jgi:hypothetical protein